MGSRQMKRKEKKHRLISTNYKYNKYNKESKSSLCNMAPKLIRSANNVNLAQ